MSGARLYDFRIRNWARGRGTIMEGRSVRNRGGNVFVELQSRQWVPVEQWNWQLLHRYCERRTIQRLRNHVGRIESRPQTIISADALSRASEEPPHD